MAVSFGITNFNFLFFTGICCILFYTLLSKHQWVMLLGMSALFFILNSEPVSVLIPLAQAFIAWISAIVIERNTSHRKRIHAMSVILMIMILIVFRYLPFIGSILQMLHISGNREFFSHNILTTIGLQYFTLSLIGYVTDVYWQSDHAESNYFKVLLFSLYFPQLTSGPITSWSEMKKELFEKHSYNQQNVLFGIERCLWGLFKKLAVADNIGKYVSFVNENYTQLHPLFILIGWILFTFEIYYEFSGCMDIIMGISQMFSIQLPENFRAPFLSCSFTDFWRRWHITMGTWFKNYVLYPMQMSSWFQHFEQSFRKKHKSKRLRKIPSYALLFFMWVIIGIWHGGEWRFVVSSGLLPWLFLVVEQIIGWDKSKKHKALHMLRTFFLYMICDIFISAGSVSSANSQIARFFQGWTVSPDLSLLLEADFGKLYFTLILAGILLNAWMDVLIDKKEDIRLRLYDKPAVLAQAALLLITVITLVTGSYGGFNAANFIYKDF